MFRRPTWRRAAMRSPSIRSDSARRNRRAGQPNGQAIFLDTPPTACSLRSVPPWPPPASADRGRSRQARGRLLKDFRSMTTSEKIPTHAATLGQLREAGYQPKTVREEMRANLIAKIRRGDPLFPGVVGYDQTVIPQIENAILSGQDIIFLGERGQAKTRLARSLVNLLDEYVPAVAGSEINDDPFAPTSKYARDLIDAHGDATPIEWIGRERRYGEKLATPDTTIADLIGE